MATLTMPIAVKAATLSVLCVHNRYIQPGGEDQVFESESRLLEEIGVRVALGAQARDVLRLVVGRGMKAAATGLVSGILGALVATRAMTALLFELRPSDPLTYGGIAALLAMAALAACYLPARRATAIDPLVALRHE